jgi:hypothetical protein
MRKIHTRDQQSPPPASARISARPYNRPKHSLRQNEPHLSPKISEHEKCGLTGSIRDQLKQKHLHSQVDEQNLDSPMTTSGRVTHGQRSERLLAMPLMDF